MAERAVTLLQATYLPVAETSTVYGPAREADQP